MSEKFVKVPFKREEDESKTFFLPDCRMTKGYEIGARDKDKERGIQDYWVALEKLMAMPQPRFRRRNKNGISGTVTCAPGDVEEVSRDYIESERAKYGG
ncbi:hypothetical protein OPU71_00540 [Niveibacterium sp. 24ML]|uniref:hypothetical protein n=1 Tax=Niveibacterium sp. 24ML TaxID=2985512 RepID=UPI0022712183|nr:hypothetical protein [Niveibacterium sp. 24ML]MCX9154606.1 hypothetical protein [Niveibacterium sp. 24ML]